MYSSENSKYDFESWKTAMVSGLPAVWNLYYYLLDISDYDSGGPLCVTPVSEGLDQTHKWLNHGHLDRVILPNLESKLLGEICIRLSAFIMLCKPRFWQSMPEVVKAAINHRVSDGTSEWSPLRTGEWSFHCLNHITFDLIEWTCTSPSSQVFSHIARVAQCKIENEVLHQVSDIIASECVIINIQS